MTAPRAPRIQRIHRVAVGLAILGAAIAIYQGRRAFIRSFFVRGAPAAPPDVRGDQGTAGAALVPESVRHLRVVLIDGAGRVSSATPRWRALCDHGLALTVDVGFPTVSLPVQSVLWTGRTQAQSGIQFIGSRIEPPLTTVASAVSGSIAIAESHPYIVHSLDFASVLPDDPEMTKSDQALWREDPFTAAATTAVRSDARLVFIHLLGPDVAGHASGSASPAYAEAIARADAQLGALVVHRPDAHWLVLSDHAHRSGPRGGHGGADPDIRMVSACIAGPRVAPHDATGPPVHLIDLHHAVARLLGVAPGSGSAGRPLEVALARPDRGGTLPRPDASRIAVAVGLGVIALVVVIAIAGRRVWAWPWWLALAYLSVVILRGVPSLSMPMIYPPLGRDMYLAALPGLLVLAVVAGAMLRRMSLWHTIAALLVPPAAAAAATLALCWGTPPLMPVWTAHASLALTLAACSTLIVGLAVLVDAAATACCGSP